MIKFQELKTNSKTADAKKKKNKKKQPWKKNKLIEKIQNLCIS